MGVSSFEFRVFGGVEAGGVALGGDAFQHTPRIIRHGTEYDRHLRLDDAALLGRDLGNRVTEPVAVIKADAGDDADLRLLHEIGRIEPSTQPGFKDEVIDPFPRIKFKCRRRQKFEVGELGVES